jgi:hypothetical protein
VTGKYTASFNKLIAPINQELRNHSFKDTVITRDDAIKLHRKYGGRCVYCGLPLVIRTRAGRAGYHFTFDTPLDIGGLPTVDNLVISCHTCKEARRPVREMRMEIPGINSFADKCEALFKAILNDESYKKIQIIKRHIDTTLEAITINFRYKPLPEWKPERFELFKEDYNTLSDRLSDLGEAVINDDTDETKKRLTEGVKQIVTTRRYKVIRSNAEE